MSTAAYHRYSVLLISAGRSPSSSVVRRPRDRELRSRSMGSIVVRLMLPMIDTINSIDLLACNARRVLSRVAQRVLSFAHLSFAARRVGIRLSSDNRRRQKGLRRLRMSALGRPHRPLPRAIESLGWDTATKLDAQSRQNTLRSHPCSGSRRTRPLLVNLLLRQTRSELCRGFASGLRIRVVSRRFPPRWYLHMTRSETWRGT